jgi:hypothetical protein
VEADLKGQPPYEAVPELLQVAETIARSLEEK